MTFLQAAKESAKDIIGILLALVALFLIGSIGGLILLFIGIGIMLMFESIGAWGWVIFGSISILFLWGIIIKGYMKATKEN